MFPVISHRFLRDIEPVFGGARYAHGRRDVQYLIDEILSGSGIKRTIPLLTLKGVLGGCYGIVIEELVGC